MTCYIISFQAKELTTRNSIRNKLREYKQYCPIQTTCWAIVTDDNAKKVRDELASLLGADDSLFVIRSGTEAAWRKTPGIKNNEWLKKNL